MKEDGYRYLGWSVLIATILVALMWCIDGTGLALTYTKLIEKVTKQHLSQMGCLLSFVTLCLPGYIAKQYCERLAWQAHLDTLPPPDIHEAAKKSKYIQVKNAPPPAPKPVETSSLPKGQEEFIATCSACGHLFPAKRSTKELKCPNCGEIIPTT